MSESPMQSEGWPAQTTCPDNIFGSGQSGSELNNAYLSIFDRKRFLTVGQAMHKPGLDARTAKGKACEGSDGIAH